MKHTRILRILGIAVVLSILLTLVPASIASAAPAASISPSTQTVGGRVNFTGTGWATYTTGERFCDVYITDQAVSLLQQIDTAVTRYKAVSVGVTITPETGAISGYFNVPATLNEGTLGTTTPVTLTAGMSYTVIFTDWYVWATPLVQNKVVRAIATLTVAQGATLNTLNPATGAPGTDVIVSGYNFPASGTLTFKLDGVVIPIKSGDTTTTPGGTFYTTITIPATATIGAHTVSATVGTSTASATFTVTAAAAITLVPTSGSPGSTVVVTGSAYPANTALTFLFDGAVITPTAGSNTVISAAGAFTSILTVPSTATNGAHIITATAATTSVTATFTVTGATTTPPPTTETTPPPTSTTTTPPPTGNPNTSIQLLSGTNAIGATLTLIGMDFAAGATVYFSYDSNQVASGVANNDGFVSASFVVPPGAHGEHTISATDGINSDTLVFTIESTPPPVPQPLKPGNGAKVKSPVIFDWEDVTDPSIPVTYNLQIATDASFTAGTIVIDKSGLKESGYTLTSDEVEKLASKQITYYWRESSTDGAQNQSAWTGVGAFTVTPPFKFTGWPMYLTIGIGAILIFVLGLWIGRRTAFYY